MIDVCKPAFLSSILFGAIVACSSPGDDPGEGLGEKQNAPSAPESDGGDTALPDTTPKTCNALDLAGLSAGTVAGSTEAAPQAAGGDIPDGTYEFVEAVMYGLSDDVPASEFLRSRIVVTGKTVQTIARTVGDETEAPLSTTETYEPSDSTLTITTTCPTGIPEETATFDVVQESGKTRLGIYRSRDGVVIGSFYEKE